MYPRRTPKAAWPWADKKATSKAMLALHEVNLITLGLVTSKRTGVLGNTNWFNKTARSPRGPRASNRKKPFGFDKYPVASFQGDQGGITPYFERVEGKPYLL